MSITLARPLAAALLLTGMVVLAVAALTVSWVGPGVGC